MDSLILEGVLRILERALSGHSLLAWDRLAEGEYLLRFATAAGDNLKISLRSPYPALYRLPHRDTPKPIDPDPFSGLAARELEGATLLGLSRRGCDRAEPAWWCCAPTEPSPGATLPRACFSSGLRCRCCSIVKPITLSRTSSRG